MSTFYINDKRFFFLLNLRSFFLEKKAKESNEEKYTIPRFPFFEFYILFVHSSDYIETRVKTNY